MSNFSTEILRQTYRNASERHQLQSIFETVDDQLIAPNMSEQTAPEDRLLLLEEWLRELAQIFETDGQSDNEVQWMSLAIAYLLTTRHIEWFSSTQNGNSLMAIREYGPIRARLPLSRLNILSTLLGTPRVSMGTS